MKKRILFIFILILSMIFCLQSCASTDEGYIGGGSGSSGYYSYEKSSSSVDSVDGVAESKRSEIKEASESIVDSESGERADGEERDGGTTEDSEYAKEEEEELQSGTLTCFAWNDNDHYEEFKQLFQKGQTTETDGKWCNYTDLWNFTSLNRVKVTVKNGETAVVNAKVVATDENGENAFTAVTDSNGVAYLFPAYDNGSLSIASGTATASAEFTEESKDIAVTLTDGLAKQNLIEIMFVIDATGSMGDEMSYLQKELQSVISNIYTQTQANINVAFLFYRDDGDSEKFAYSDFVNIKETSEYNKQLQFLKSKSADGGGDYEEAVDEALLMATEKQWSGGTKLIFHLHDAPPHSKTINKTRYTSAIKNATSLGIRICPILASGADALTEYLARQSAITTGGTSVFLTDDSGIGGEHLDPDLPDVTIEKLNACLVRLVNGYYSGVFADPVSIYPAEETQSED